MRETRPKEKDGWDKFVIITQGVSIAMMIAGLVFLWGWTLGWWWR